MRNLCGNCLPGRPLYQGSSTLHLSREHWEREFGTWLRNLSCSVVCTCARCSGAALVAERRLKLQPVGLRGHCLSSAEGIDGVSLLRPKLSQSTHAPGRNTRFRQLTKTDQLGLCRRSGNAGRTRGFALRAATASALRLAPDLVLFKPGGSLHAPSAQMLLHNAHYRPQQFQGRSLLQAAVADIRMQRSR